VKAVMNSAMDLSENILEISLQRQKTNRPSDDTSSSALFDNMSDYFTNDLPSFFNKKAARLINFI